jgi:hypothetical protein
MKKPVVADPEIVVQDPKSDPDAAKTELREKRETVRANLAKVVVYSYLGIAAAVLISGIFFAGPNSSVPEVATLIFGPLTGIVGTVIGFYFGESRS